MMSEKHTDPSNGNETTLSAFLQALKSLTIFALFLFVVSSCSYYSVMAVMNHNPSVTYDDRAIKTCWVIFFMVALATIVMRETFTENMVKTVFFLIAFLLSFQSPYALHIFSALLGSFIGSIFVSRE